MLNTGYKKRKVSDVWNLDPSTNPPDVKGYGSLWTNSATGTLNYVTPAGVSAPVGGGDQGVNTTDEVEFKKVTVSDTTDATLVLKDSDAGTIGAVSASVDMVDSTDTVASSLSLDGSGNLELKNNNTAKLLTLGSGTTNIIVDDSISGGITTVNSNVFVVQDTTQPIIDMYDNDTVAAAMAGQITWEGSDTLAGRIRVSTGSMTMENLVTSTELKLDSNGLTSDDIVAQTIKGTNTIPTNDFPDEATGATTLAGYIISASSEFTGATPAWKAFDNDIASAWISGENYVSGLADGTNTIDGWSSEYITVQSPDLLYLASYSITVAVASSAPKHFRIYGSVDGTSWTQVEERTNETGWVVNTPRSFTLSAPSAGYKFFSLAVREINATNVFVTRIYDINFTATENCPTNSSLDITSCLNVAGSMGDIQCKSITFQKPCAEMYWENNTTSMTQGGTFTKVLGATSTANLGNTKFTHTSPNKLTYIGTRTMTFHTGASFSFAQVGGGAVDWTFQLYKNSIAIPGSRARRQTTNNSYGSTAIHSFITLSTNDYVELWVSGNGSTNDIIVSDLNVFLLALPNVVA